MASTLWFLLFLHHPPVLSDTQWQWHNAFTLWKKSFLSWVAQSCFKRWIKLDQTVDFTSLKLELTLNTDQCVFDKTISPQGSIWWLFWSYQSCYRFFISRCLSCHGTVYTPIFMSFWALKSHLIHTGLKTELFHDRGNNSWQNNLTFICQWRSCDMSESY